MHSAYVRMRTRHVARELRPHVCVNVPGCLKVAYAGCGGAADVAPTGTRGSHSCLLRSLCRYIIVCLHFPVTQGDYKEAFEKAAVELAKAVVSSAEQKAYGHMGNKPHELKS